MRLRGPDLDLEAGNPREIPGVDGRHLEVQRHSGGADDEVVGAHHVSLLQELGPQPCVRTGCLQAELDDGKARQDGVDEPTSPGPRSRVTGPVDSVEQLAGRQRADRKRLVLVAADTLGEGETTTLRGDEDARVDQEAHGACGTTLIALRPDSTSRSKPSASAGSR